MVSVQMGASFAKGLFPIIGPYSTVLLRISIAAAILVLIWRPWRQSLGGKWLNKSSLKALVLYGTCLGLMNMTFYLALTRIPLGICVALEFTGPLAVALLASKKKIDFIWAILAALGICLILPLKAEQTALDPIGILLALFAGTCWAFYIVFGKRVGTMVHGGIASSLGMVIASLVTVPFVATQIVWSDLTPKILLLGTGVALLSSAIPYTIEMFAMKKVPTKTFGILMSLEPAIAALSGLLMLNEKLDSTQWLAIVCVIMASAGSAKTSKQEQPQSQPPLQTPA